MGNSSIIGHSDVLIGDNVFVWGGDRPKKQPTLSRITVFNILRSSLDTRPTTGTPPYGIIDYSSCCIGEDIYYFGGQYNDYYCNNLFVLSTKSFKWREIYCDSGPLKKANCGMVPFHICGKAYLLVIGGRGPIPSHHTSDCFVYMPHPLNPPLCFTNEVHIMCISSTPGKWTVPKLTGCVFPPLIRFTINTLPGSNKAIVFGGVSILDNRKIVCTNDVFILTYFANDNSMNIEKLEDLILTRPVQEPLEGRSHHSSVIITSLSSDRMKKTYLLLLGGLNAYDTVLADAWILSIDDKRWNKVDLPEVVCGRYGHSMTRFKMSANCVWLLITGGLSLQDKQFAGTNLIELGFSSSNNNWIASKVMNEKDMKNKSNHTKLVSDQLKFREKEYQLMVESVIEEDEIKLLEQKLQQKEEEVKHYTERMDDLCKDLEKHYQLILEREETICDLNKKLKEPSQLENHPHFVIQDEEVNITDEIIGSGAYGEVREAVFRGTRVAAKLLHNLIVAKYNIDKFVSEMEICSRIHHPNIVQFIGAIRINNPILLYELMPTSLHKRLQDDESLTRAQIVSIGSDICTAMCYLHQWRPQPIIHRDISSPNVLMEPLPNDKWRAKLADFGSANLQLLIIYTTNPGNPFYSAPEADNPRHHSPAMDVYSFGVLLAEMILHRLPEKDIMKHKQNADNIDWFEMRKIVFECIDSDRSQRISSKQLLADLKQLKN